MSTTVPVPEQPPSDDIGASPDPGDEATPSPILEMRQVAGLTAGSVMDLHVGSFQFSETEGQESGEPGGQVGFSLVVRGPDDVVVVPGATSTFVDDLVAQEPTLLGRSLINVGSACFAVCPPRPAPTGHYRLAALEEARQPAEAIAVPDGLTDDPADGGQPDNQGWSLLRQSIVEARHRVAERHRMLHPDPEQLKSRLDRMDPGLWDRGRDHPMFGRFALAYSTIPWEPRFDNPEGIPANLHEPIRELGRLPWVPVTANLLHGPVGLVGPRPAVLAAARNALLSLACLSAPFDIAFSIVTAKANVDAWSWSSALPDELFLNGSDAFPIAVADGMVHFEGAGFEHEAVLRNTLGLIVLGESIDELPEYCATVVQISPDGRCQVTNHLGEQVVATPIGITVALATDMAESVSQALRAGAPPPPEPEPEPEPAVEVAAPKEPTPPTPIPSSDGGERPSAIPGADPAADPDRTMAADQFVEELSELFQGPDEA